MLLLFLLLLPDTTVISYQAKKIIYNFTDSTIVMIDSAQIEYEELILNADTCHYYYNDNLLVSFPKSTILRNGDSLVGTICRYNTKTKTAMIENGRANVEKGYVYGDEIWLVGEKEFNIKNGYYTTCDVDPPHYGFYASRMKVYLDDIAIGEPVLMKVRGIPTLAAPFWFVPISKKRKSGLVPFRLGRSNTEGEYIKDFSYYLVINDYSDVTFTTDVMRKKGIRPKLSLIYDYSPILEGNWFGSYIYETDTKQRRFDVNGYNRTDRFLFKSKLTARIEYQSDESYVQEYAEEKPLLLKRELYSHLTLSRSIKGAQNTMRVERRVDYDKNTVKDRLPRYDLSLPTINVGDIITSPNFFFIREKENNQVVMAANLKVPVTTAIPISYFTYSPSINLDLAGYDQDTLGHTFPYRFGYSTSHDLSTTLYRLYSLEFFGLTGLLHRVIPRIGYQYSPQIENPAITSIGGISSYNKRSSFYFSLDNSFETKYGDRRIRLLDINSSINYNRIKDSLSPAHINLFSRPIDIIDLQASFVIDPYTGEVTKSFSEGISIKTAWADFKVNHTLSDYTHQLWAEFNPMTVWGIDLTAGTRYDFNEGKIIEYSANVIKDLHCWEILFTYASLGTEWRYDVKLRIKEIPEIEIGKGLLGILPE